MFTLDDPIDSLGCKNRWNTMKFCSNFWWSPRIQGRSQGILLRYKPLTKQDDRPTGKILERQPSVSFAFHFSGEWVSFEGNISRKSMEHIVDQSKCVGGGNPANFNTGHTGIAFNQGFNLSEVGHGSTIFYILICMLHYTSLYVCVQRIYI